MPRAARRIVVHGRVQGVFYRASALRQAKRLGVCGWVQNLPEGSVEIHAEGEEALLDQFEDWCRKGPPAAKVSSLESNSAPPSGLSDFSVR